MKEEEDGWGFIVLGFGILDGFGCWGARDLNTQTRYLALFGLVIQIIET